jgi:hypothetical protein
MVSWWNFNPTGKENNGIVFFLPILLFALNTKEMRVIWKSNGIFH